MFCSHLLQIIVLGHALILSARENSESNTPQECLDAQVTKSVFLKEFFIHGYVPKPTPQEARRKAWISAETWQLIDKRVSTRQDPQYGKADRRRLGKEIKESLSQDRRRRTEEAGAEVETMMKADPPLLQEA